MFKYTVTNFAENKANDRILFSNIVYDQQNIAWRLRIDCNGHEEQGRFISIYLELLNGAAGWYG